MLAAVPSRSLAHAGCREIGFDRGKLIPLEGKFGGERELCANRYFDFGDSLGVRSNCTLL